MKRLLPILALLLLLTGCVSLDAEECMFCDESFNSFYCPLKDGICPSCSAKYGEECYVCGKSCHFHYIEISDPQQILCYSCAEDLLNELL